MDVQNHSGSSEIPTFKALEWNISSSLYSKLTSAKENAAKVLTNCELTIAQYNEYGANWIKKVGK